MKQTGAISTAILFLLAAITVPAYAGPEQQGKEGKSHQGQEQGKSQQGREQGKSQHGKEQGNSQQGREQQVQHGQRREQAQPAQQQHQQQAERSAQRQGRPQQSRSAAPQHQGRVRSGFGQSRASSWNSDHHTWSQRGGYDGYRVPQDRYSLYFGSNHYFRMHGLPMVYVGGYPRFQYNGYWVTFVDPWPEMWPDAWYQTDDVYVNYGNDGYYLYNRRRPGVGIAVTISL